MFEFIREFQVLAEHLNFTSAARELGLSQSGLSRHMAALEHELGFALLVRNPVKLTQAGAHYLEHVGALLGSHDRLVRECVDLSEKKQSPLRIAMAEPNGQSACMAYSILAAMHDEDAGFSYELVAERAKTVEQLVSESAADVALAYCAPGDGAHQVDAGNPNEWGDQDRAVVYDFMYNEPLSAWVHEANPVLDEGARLEDLAACCVPVSSNRMFKTLTDGICALLGGRGRTPKTRTKDASSLSEFLVMLKEDEVVLASRFSRYMAASVNPCACEVRFSSGTTLVGPVYLVYRAADDNPALQRFVSRFRCEAGRHQAQVLREMRA